MGTLGTTASPNDPVFWLLHANIDRLWSQWEARHGDAYLPRSGAPQGHNLNDLLNPFARLGRPVRPADLLDSTALGVFYV